MSLLWTSDDLIAATDGRPFGQMPAGVTGISIDSRTLRPGEAFFAIRGDQSTATISRPPRSRPERGSVVSEGSYRLGRLSAPMIVVPDVLSALEKAGAAARERTRAKVIAVTGSAGKTSTKEALRHALSAVGKVHAADKSFNNHWGVPLTLARTPQDCDFAVFEIGMNNPAKSARSRNSVAAYRDHYADRRSASRPVPQPRRDRPRQGRDFRGHRAGRLCDPQP